MPAAAAQATGQRKGIATARVKLDANGPGTFMAVFSNFGVIDSDGDITLPGAIQDGASVKVSYWGHRWHDLPAGRGIIRTDGESAWIEGAFFLDTTHGRDHYETVKALGDLCEWSYGYDILDADRDVRDGVAVQILKKLHVFEVSPVLRGAGVGTHTVSVKAGRVLSASNLALVEDAIAALSRLRDAAAREDESGKADTSGQSKDAGELARIAGELAQLVDTMTTEPAKAADDDGEDVTDDDHAGECADCGEPVDGCTCQTDAKDAAADSARVKAAALTAAVTCEATRAAAFGVNITNRSTE